MSMDFDIGLQTPDYSDATIKMTGVRSFIVKMTGVRSFIVHKPDE
jgi:hypothetical protein